MRLKLKRQRNPLQRDIQSIHKSRPFNLITKRKENSFDIVAINPGDIETISRDALKRPSISSRRSHDRVTFRASGTNDLYRSREGEPSFRFSRGRVSHRSCTRPEPLAPGGDSCLSHSPWLRGRCGWPLRRAQSSPCRGASASDTFRRGPRTFSRRPRRRRCSRSPSRSYASCRAVKHVRRLGKSDSKVLPPRWTVSARIARGGSGGGLTITRSALYYR